MHQPSLRLGLIAALVLLAGWAVPAQAIDPIFTAGGLAIRGYDPVAYFTDGAPVPGKPELEASWNGAAWRFASAEHREAFLREPERYAPQYGGYCAWAVSQGYTASVDPTAWTIAGGKLYLNYSHSVKRRWERDVPGNIAKGDRNWPKILEGK